MESFKVMEKFDGGNFHLWKFKMHMMLSKHGFWKFVDGSATIPHDEDQITDYNEKATKTFTLLCEHLKDAQLAKMSKMLGKHFVVSMKPRPLEISCFFKGGSSPSKCKKGRICLRTSTW